jgi:subtilase family serine protease
MKNKLISLTIIMLLSSAMFLATTSIAFAQSVIAGVSKGETFDYSYSLIWTSTDPSATPPNDLVEYNNTQKIQFKITNVEGPDIGVDFVRLFNNGTQTVQSGSINIESGTVSVPYGFLIVSANLNKNQQVYPTGGHQVITDTVTRSFAGIQRETNVISSEDSSEKTTIDFDRAKGVAFDYLFEIREASGNYNIVSTETLTNTNSNDWAVASSTLSLPLIAIVIVIIAIIIVAVAIAVFRKKRKPNISA